MHFYNENIDKKHGLLTRWRRSGNKGGIEVNQEIKLMWGDRPSISIKGSFRLSSKYAFPDQKFKGCITRGYDREVIRWDLMFGRRNERGH